MRDKLGRFIKGNKINLGKRNSPETEFKKGHAFMGNKECLFKKGHIPWSKGKHIQLNTGRTHFKKGHIIWNKGTHIQTNSGITHFKKGQTAWNKGKNDGLPHRESGRSEYRNWRRAILKRDNYFCQVCGKKGCIEVHHLLPWAIYPEQRYDVNNGITLCSEHHYKVLARS